MIAEAPFLATVTYMLLSELYVPCASNFSVDYVLSTVAYETPTVTGLMRENC